jgi:lysozyme
MAAKKRKKTKKRGVSLERVLGIVMAVLVAGVLIWLVGTSPWGRSLFRKLPGEIQRVFTGGPLVPIATGYGIDVSRYQETIDWSQVKTINYNIMTRRQGAEEKSAHAEIEFVFAKATEGANYEDPQITYNRDGIRKAGLSYGAYHVLTFADTTKQAKNFIRVAKLRKGDFVPVIDMETSMLGGTFNAKVEKTLRGVANALEKKYGQKPIIYCPTILVTELRKKEWAKDYTLWIPHYSAITRPSGADFWQFSDKGTVDGIPGVVDLDCYYGDRSKLRGLILKK